MHNIYTQIQQTEREAVADLEGSRAGSGPPFGWRTDTITHGHVS